jgi:AcrR family transcriptional regulator
MPRTSGKVRPRAAVDRPTHTYPVTAEKIIRAARRLVVRRGYAGFTMQSLEQESGLNRGLVHYYFGGKNGLVAALVDLLFEDPGFGFSDEVLAVPAGPMRVRALFDWLGRIIGDRSSARLFYELLPHVLRSRSLRARAADLYQLYREFDGGCLASDGVLDDETKTSLGTLSEAVVEGLVLQQTVDPQGFQAMPAFALWQEMVGTYLDSKNGKPSPAATTLTGQATMRGQIDA